MRFLDGAHCSATPQVQVRSDQSGSSAGYGTCRIVRGALAQNPRRSPEVRRTSTQAPSEKAEATSMQLRSILKACSAPADMAIPVIRSEEHTSELQSLMRISYAVFCL